MNSLLKSSSTTFLFSQLSQNLKRSLSSYSLIFKNYGNPNDVLELVDTTSEILQPNLQPDDVIVQFKASPINPADINTIQGVYAIKPKLPAVPGNEGCAEVLSVGSSVKDLEVGDKVVLIKSTLGTWQTHTRSHFSNFFKIDKRLDEFSASQTVVNPSTAYRMLKDYENLQPGDTVIQNGSNSAVGKNVIQFGKRWNLVTVNVIRKRENKQELDDLIKELKDLGANYVITEEQLEDKEFMSSLFKEIPKPRLGLNCVGGTNALNLIRHLDKNGYLVTYGAMAKRPIIVGAAPLIFKNIKIVGYWMTNWYKENARTDEHKKMLDTVVSGYLDGSLKATKPLKYKLEQYKEAIDVSMNSNVKGKVTFVP